MNNVDKSNKMLKKRAQTILIILVSTFLLFAILLVILNLNKIEDNDTVLTINGESVSKAEYLFVMSGLRPNVFSYFSRKYGTEESANFWTSSFNGEVPAEILRQKTIDLLRRIKTEQILMKKHGITDDITFSGFLEDLKTENERRRLALAKNLPVYGPVQYEDKIYYDYLHSERIEKLKRILFTSEITISEEEINNYYGQFMKVQKETDNFLNTEEIMAYMKREMLNRKYEEMIKKLMNESVLNFKLKESTLSKMNRSLLNI